MGQPVKVNDFDQCLARSKSHGLNEIWEAVYRKAFEDYQQSLLCDDLLMQKQGVDRIVFLKSGKQIRIDEKTREKDYGDILLEYLSNDRTGAPGWVRKPLHIDYIAYLIAPAQKCWLFPFEELRRAWSRCGTGWIERAKNNEKGFQLKSAANRGYNTLSVCVQVQTLTESIKNAMSVSYAQETPIARPAQVEPVLAREAPEQIALFNIPASYV